MTAAPARPGTPGAPPRRLALWMLALAVLLPAAATLYVGLVLHPGGKPAYGDLVHPQRPVPALHLRTLDGKAFDLRSLNGYWLMLVAAPGACDSACQHLLFDMRQFYLASGNDQYRVARVWLITDDAPVNPGVLAPAAGTVMLRADPQELRRWLPLAAGEPLQGPMWLVDPLGNLMLRFGAGFDPLRALPVFSKLLYNTQSWKARHLQPLPLGPGAPAEAEPRKSR
ncbi:MAG: hypothetical protein KGJ64_10555 [Betaproteobacteria bacterium]|nr:hypothetical protein [Betaproteobacteria bacterium]